MGDIGTFRTIALRDLTRVRYAGNEKQALEEVNDLLRQKLLRRSVSQPDRAVYLTLTPEGHQFHLARNGQGADNDQVFYHGFVKTREREHDAAIYQLYQKEAENIISSGGKVTRVILDFELKKSINRKLARISSLPQEEQAERKAEVAFEHGLTLVNGRIQIPDLRLEYGYQTLVFHLFSRQIYGAIDKDNLRNRRQLSKELIRTRLLILDFVLCDPNRQHLETEADKVQYFNRELGIPLTLIPCRTYKSRKSGSQTDRYFVDRFPIFLTNEPLPTPTFVYCDSDLPGLFGYLTHVRNYEQLLRRLHGFNLVYASPDSAKFRRAQGFFSRTFDSNTPVDTAQLARYFYIRQLWESHKTEFLTRADRDLLRDGDKRFQGVLFESLYQKWSAGTMTQPDLQLQFGGSELSQKRGFSTHLLPENYDIFRSANSAPIRPASENEGSKSRSTSGSISA